jgi:hypothetical protein
VVGLGALDVLAVLAQCRMRQRRVRQWVRRRRRVRQWVDGGGERSSCYSMTLVLVFGTLQLQL